VTTLDFFTKDPDEIEEASIHDQVSFFMAAFWYLVVLILPFLFGFFLCYHKKSIAAER